MQPTNQIDYDLITRGVCPTCHTKATFCATNPYSLYCATCKVRWAVTEEQVWDSARDMNVAYKTPYFNMTRRKDGESDEDWARRGEFSR